MDLIQGKGSESMVRPEVGETIILITDPNCKKMSNHKGSMPYYIGEVRSGGIANLKGVKATILCFEGAETAKNIHDCLSFVSHGHVMKSLGYGSGQNNFSSYQYLALPFFESTFEEYIKESWKCVEMGRFTMEIITIVGGIVRAMLALHKAGFCCKKLKPRDIAIVKYHNFICAKIWNFQKCTSDDMDQDWVRLGKLLKLTNHQSVEAKDLYDSLLNGKLKGIEILKHSALLTVRKKFRNVLIFYFYMVANWTKEASQDPSETSDPSVSSDPLVTSEIVQAPLWLDEHFDWKSQRKPWMFYRLLSDPPKTYRGFTIIIRHLIEHEVDFLPPELVEKIPFKDRESGTKETDLEWHIRTCWAEAFLKIQNFVRKESLNY